MQFSATVNRFIVKTYLNSAFTNDLKRKEFFSKNVNSCRLSLFKCAYGPRSEKTCLRCLRATIGADTSAHSDQCYFLLFEKYFINAGYERNPNTLRRLCS